MIKKLSALDWVGISICVLGIIICLIGYWASPEVQGKYQSAYTFLGAGLETQPKSHS